MKKILLTLTLALVCLNLGSSEETESVAAKLMDVMKVEQQMQSGFDSMMPMINQMAQQMQLGPDELVELKGIYQDWFKNDLDHQSLVNKITALYEESFTEDEIKDLIAFYQTDLGQKLTQIQPMLTQKGAMFGMQEAQSKQALLMAKLRPFMEAHMPKPPAPPTAPEAISAE